MKIKIVVSLYWVILSVMPNQGFSQGINLPDWKVLSEENQSTELTDTVFREKSCVKLDGKIKSAIWNQSASFRNFRMELDMVGALM